MSKQKQISAFVSDETNERLDLFVRETGITKGRAIEDAIGSYLDAYDELPPEAIIPTHMVLDRESWERFVRMITEDREPTPALVELMRRVQESQP